MTAPSPRTARPESGAPNTAEASMTAPDPQRRVTPAADPESCALPAGRPGRPDEMPLASLSPDPFARLTLALMRWHFHGFAEPASHGWLTALRLATERVGPAKAGPLCYDLVALVQAVRISRQSVFRFNSEACAGCRQWVTPDERRIVELLDALRRGQMGRAQTLAQMLCDGRPDSDLVAVAHAYLRRHAPDVLPCTGTAAAR